MMHTSKILIAALVAAPFTIAAELIPRVDSCQAGYTVCAPSGATTTTVPRIGDASFRSLFVDLIDTGLPDGNSKHRREFSPLISKRESVSLCCDASMLCSSMSSLAIPFCYDKFTTNYFLPDGSYGTVYFGSYTSAAGDTADLITGDYTLKSGGTGNIYSADAAEKPNTATMSIPSQFTGTGVGSAIPASVLGGFQTVVYTEVISATTIAISTMSGSVLTSTGGGASGTPYVTTLPATTIMGTTITAATTLVTTATVGASDASSIVSSASAAAAAATSKAAAMEGIRVGWEILAGSLVMGAAVIL